MTPPALPDRAVDVVFRRLDLPDDALAVELALLSADERDRADRFLVDRARRRFVAARAALRRALGARLAADPATLTFATGRSGKPALADRHAADRLAFNLSHSGDLAAIALVDGPAPPPVGVDIEAIRPLDDLDGLARVAFHPAELAAWRSMPETGRLAGFYRRWTFKEAVMKAVGLGLHLAPRAFALADDPAGHAVLAESADRRADAGTLAVAPLAVPAPAMAGAVALFGAVPKPREFGADSDRGG